MARSVYEIKAHKQLVGEGYIVDFKARVSRPIRGYHYDFFNLFDLVCYKPNEPLRWISIKGHAYAPRAHREALIAFKMMPGNIKELWIYKIHKTIKREIIE